MILGSRVLLGDKLEIVSQIISIKLVCVTLILLTLLDCFGTKATWLHFCMYLGMFRVIRSSNI